MTRNLRPGPKYFAGVIVQKLGPLSYLVEVGHGKSTLGAKSLVCNHVQFDAILLTV